MTVADPAPPALRVRGLTKRYGASVALAGVDLTVAPGELRGLLGPNGAGKTTLLRTLFGLIRADEGTVELLGHTLTDRANVPLSGVAGFVEDPAFYPYLSGRANLELLARLDDSEDADIDSALARVGLDGRGRDRVGSYSTGMRQRLGIAAALLRDPRLLLLDEPTSGLDPAGIHAVSTLLGELAADGVAVLLSSHLIGELETLCDAYTIIRSGEVVWDGDARRLEAEAPGSVYALATSDDDRALRVADDHPRLEADRVTGASEIRLVVEPGALDDYVLALGNAGVAVRRLELLVSPLKTMFFALTAEDAEPAASGGVADGALRESAV